ncbi:MAG: D-hexose-6-phosphate mutarotase, partial [Oleibacter sp.]|nr:D-hexose-6-phosphate mutarotase [Thalassolituus sp.]
PYRFCSAITRGELEGINVTHADFSAVILLQGAQLLEFTVAGQPWIWLSETAEYKKGAAVRGGIPICWPWFGDADKNPAAVQSMIDLANAPAHGFARSQDWQINAITEHDDRVELTFILKNDDSNVSQNNPWRGDANLAITFTLSATGLTLALTTTAGNQPVTISQALHTYFPTDDIFQTRVSGFDGFSYIDALDGWSNKTQQGDIIFSAETDRIYAAPTKQTIHTPKLTLSIACNSASAVVWNPWIEKSKRLSQFADDAWQRMLCVESANVMDDVVTLNAGEICNLTLALTLADE